MRIGHKLVLGSLALSLLVCAVGFYAVVVSRQVLQSTIEDTSTELAAEFIEGIDREIDDRMNFWAIVSTDPLMHHLLQCSNERFEKLSDMQTFINDKDRQWRAAPKGKATPLMNEVMSDGVSTQLKRILKASDNHGGCSVYGEVFLTNRYGANVAQTAITSDYRQDDEHWWQETMSNGEFVGKPEYDASAGTMAMDLCVRVDDDQGNPLGVVKAVLNLQTLATLLQQWDSGSRSLAASQGGAHYLFVLADDDKVIFDSHNGKVRVGGSSQYDYDFGRPGPGQTGTFVRNDEAHGGMLAAYAVSNGNGDYQGQGWTLIVENSESAILAPVTALRDNIALMSVAIALAAFAVAIIFSLSLSRRMKRLQSVALDVGRGDLKQRCKDRSSDEIGQLAQSINQMAESQEEVVHQAHTVAEGDYSSDIAPRGENDELADAINSMVSSLRDVVVQANTIADGDYSAEMTPRSEKDELGVALNKMTANLREVSLQNETDNWLKTGQAELSDAMRGELDLPTLSKNVISYLAKYMNAQVGAMYLADGSGTLRMTGSYAFSKRKRLTNEIQLGEGLVGQAALEKESIAICEVPEDYITVNSGLGEAVPRHLLAAPMVLAGEVKGVLELGTFEPFSDTQIEFLKLVSENISIAINSSQDRGKMGQLLGESQQQAEKLQAQQEELRAANEELEEQTEALKRSEEQLKTQSEELQATNEELEEKSEYLSKQKADIQTKNRKLEVVGRDLEEKARDLELASKYKSEFLANMSHELRTPLNSLLILSKTLANNEEGNLTDEQVESAKVIQDGGKELLNLINEILDLSKVEAGRLDVHIEDIGLDSVLGHLQGQFKPVAEQKNIQFNIEKTRDVPEVIRTDGQRTEQILKNLLSNAFKFTAKGSVTLSIHPVGADVRFQHSELTAGNSIGISITDTGIGIPHDRQRAIFEAFHQADGSTSRRYGGTGLGLAISRELAKLLGGEIQLQSREGEGSRFTLYLPLEHESSPQIESNAQPTPVSPVTRSLQTTPSTTEGQRTKPIASGEIPQVIPDDREQLQNGDNVVLIVEDDTRFAKIMVDLSRKRGCKCLVACDGSSGLQLAFEYKPSGIILDLGLPDIDGLNVLGQLKHDLRTRHIPVHVISARDDIADSMRKGAVGHMTKPASADDVEKAFAKIEETSLTHVKTVLVVEDNPELRRNLVKLIDNKGIEITAVGSGEEACDKVSNGRFDCIILDLGLPDMTGFELLRRFEDLKSGDIPPVIVYTGRSLTPEEHTELSRYTDRIVLKGADSENRVLDEVSLFLHSVESTLPAEQQKVIRMLHDPDQVLQGRKVLLVDDDMRNTFALSKVLQQSGVDIVMADNGALALEKLDGDPEIELVVMDIMMPVMDGYEAMRKIRAQRRFEKLPIIALTAKAMKEDRKRCLEAGANDYLPKPVDSKRLVSMMRVWLYR